MTDAERRVLAVYPDAECWRQTTSGVPHGYGVIVMSAIRPGGYTETIGIGDTPDAAWEDAARRLASDAAPR